MLKRFDPQLVKWYIGYAVYDYGNGEKPTTRYPAFVNFKLLYLIEVVTPLHISTLATSENVFILCLG